MNRCHQKYQRARQRQQRRYRIAPCAKRSVQPRLAQAQSYHRRIVAEKLKPYSKGFGKPVLASWMGGAEVAAGEEILNQAGIPVFRFPDSAVRAFNYMWRYAYNLKAIYETPTMPEHAPLQLGKAERIIDDVRQSGRAVLTEYESKQLLKAYDIPTVETRIAVTEQEALEAAEEMGYPIVLKLYSLTITHKTDVGGVELNLRDAAAVKTAFHAIKQSVAEKAGAEHFQGVTVQPMVKLDGYELIIGSSLDSQFARCFYSAPAANSWRSSRTAPWRYRR